MLIFQLLCNYFQPSKIAFPGKITAKIRNNKITQTHQSYAFRILELDVRDALEPSRLVAHDQPHVPHLANRAEELLQVPGPDPL